MQNLKRNSILALALSLALASCTQTPHQQESVTTSLPKEPFAILYSANLNGELEPCGCRVNPTGGIGRRANFIKTIPAPTLSVDSGDLLFDTSPIPDILLPQKKAQAESLIQAYNLLGVQYFVPGELDFAAGTEEFKNLLSKAKFKPLAANLFLKDRTTLLLNAYSIVTLAGLKIGIFGLYSDHYSNLTPDDLFVAPALPIAKKIIAELLSKGVQRIIVLSHLGLDDDRKLASEVGGIQYIFGGHSNSFLNEPEHVNDTFIFQTSLRGGHMGVFQNAQNSLTEMNAQWDSQGRIKNPLEKLMAENKKKIDEINKRIDDALFNANKVETRSPEHYQTFARCAICHKEQYAFYKNTKHAQAYQTLVNVHQNNNLECLKCHTLGQDELGGYTSVHQLVKNSKNQEINAENFAKSLPQMGLQDLKKISLAYINVQCEHCHLRGDDHPRVLKSVSSIVFPPTCVRCHTEERAPAWYRDGKLNTDLVLKKFKEISCPAIKR